MKIFNYVLALKVIINIGFALLRNAAIEAKKEKEHYETSPQ